MSRGDCEIGVNCFGVESQAAGVMTLQIAEFDYYLPECQSLRHGPALIPLPRRHGYVE